jgi:DMSO/TMAO reductase YedYZ molybdopterin-dependent catalytic subunit
MDAPSPAADAPLPAGQRATARLAITGERGPGANAPAPDVWQISVTGLVARPFTIALPDLLSRSARELERDIHCVTGWSRRACRFEGLPLRELLDEAGVDDQARFVRFLAHSDHDHHTSLPLDVARADTFVAWGLDGGPLPMENGGPVRTVTPSRWFYKSLKWLRRIELLAEDRLGTWEDGLGYHNVGDPWSGERFVTGAFDRDKTRRLMAATRLDPYRGQVILNADFRGWDPKDRDLQRLVIKNSDLRGAQLAGVDLRHANLSVSDLRGASLRGADLRDADLEGVDFAGADLRDADLRGASLLATRFFAGDAATAANPALVSGMRYDRSGNLLEDARAFLLREWGRD